MRRSAINLGDKELLDKYIENRKLHQAHSEEYQGK
jgi:hypothetical protein